MRSLLTHARAQLLEASRSGITEVDVNIQELVLLWVERRCVAEVRMPLVANNMIVHGSQGCVLLMESVMGLRRVESRHATRKELPGIYFTLLRQALLSLGGQGLVVDP